MVKDSFGYKHKMFQVKNRFVKLVFRNIQLAYFYRVYSGLFTEELIENATYTSQWIDRKNRNHQQLLKDVEELLKIYANASMVITSRIHCALPSLGCDTPVLFVTSEELKSNTDTKVGGRLGGLSAFFNLIICDKNRLRLSPDCNFKIHDKISSSFNFLNKQTYIPYRDSLLERCKVFACNR